MQKISNLFFTFILIVTTQWSFAQSKDYHRVVFYNVENLYDTSDDPLTFDDDFTFRGKKNWNKNRYSKKLVNLAKVLSLIDENGFPAFIGLAEIENRRVLEDLINKTSLEDGNYGIVHKDSPDPRGIDVAFLYNKQIFKIINEDFHQIVLEENAYSRDILYCVGEINNCDTIHFFVCHFPSMRGGEKNSEWKRIHAANILKTKVDSIQIINSGSKIIIMGDFNGKSNTQAQQVLYGKPTKNSIIHTSLYNQGYNYLYAKAMGTYKYNGEWQTIDHIIVSGALLKDGLKHSVSDKSEIFSPDFLLEEDKNFHGTRPYPSYRGLKYLGGYSDHLPIYIDLFYYF